MEAKESESDDEITLRTRERNFEFFAQIFPPAGKIRVCIPTPFYIRLFFGFASSSRDFRVPYVTPFVTVERDLH